MASPTTTRNLQDAQLSVTANLPNAANTVNTSGIDLGSAVPYPITEQLTAQISHTAAPGANNKNINFRIMDSADNSTFANVAVLGNPILQSVDANGNGHSANSLTLALPPTIRRYIRCTAVGEANGGDSSAGTFTLKLLF